RCALMIGQFGTLETHNCPRLSPTERPVVDWVRLAYQTVRARRMRSATGRFGTYARQDDRAIVMQYCGDWDRTTHRFARMTCSVRSASVAGRLCLAALLLVLASGAAAQQLRPVGDFTFFARDGVSEIMGLLVFASDPGAPAARISIPGQQSLVFQSMRLDGRTVTLSERAGDAVIELVLVFDTDSTFSGTWRMGDQQGPVSGRRGVLPGAVEPSCREYAVDPPPSAAREPTSDPDSARIFTRDVHLFWEVLDGSTPDDLIERLHCGYLRGGSDAVRDFIPGRILSAARLAEMIQSRRDRYDEVRAATLALDTMEQVIRDVFHSMKRLLPEAVFPDVHFVIGRLNTGGTTSARGLLIGAEMYRS